MNRGVSSISPKSPTSVLRAAIFGLAAVSLTAVSARSAEEMAGDVQVEKAIQQLKKIATAAFEKSKVPGMAIVIVHKGEPVFLNFGVRKAGTNDKVTEDTVFQLASVSKPITSTIIARLVGHEVLSWDDPIVKYDPSFRLKDPYVTQHVTFRDLLSHRSGLPDHAGDLLEDLGFKRAEILSRLRYYPLENRFRAEYNYTNYGVTAAGTAAALATKTGQPWETVAANQLYRPLGMTSTSSKFADYAKSPNRAYGHVPADGKWFANGKWAPLFERNADAQSPGGGVSSTTRDLAKWLSLQLANGEFEGEPLIEAAALEETHQPVMVNSFDPMAGKLSSYGVCWIASTRANGVPIFKHSGEFCLGARTIVSMCPAVDTGIIVLVNAAPTGLPEGLEMSFFDLVFDGKISPPNGFSDWITFADEQFRKMTEKELHQDKTDYEKKPKDFRPPSLPLAGYAGVYQNRFYGPLTVKANGSTLSMTIGPSAETFALTHFTADTFFIETRGEMRSGNSGVLFKISGGKASGLTINAYNSEDLGEFKRSVPDHSSGDD